MAIKVLVAVRLLRIVRILAVYSSCLVDKELIHNSSCTDELYCIWGYGYISSIHSQGTIIVVARGYWWMCATRLAIFHLVGSCAVICYSADSCNVMD